MSNKKHHAEWLSLLEISGPFVSLPVLEKVFPQGLDAHDAEHARRMRLAFDEWETNQSGHKPDRAIHRAWIEFVLKETLILPEEVVATGQSIPQTIKATHSEAGEVIRPDFLAGVMIEQVIWNGNGKPYGWDLGIVKTRKRIIYLDAFMQELTAKLVERYGEGHLFQNRRGSALQIGRAHV
mgnify:CR=1 FL=1